MNQQFNAYRGDHDEAIVISKTPQSSPRKDPEGNTYPLNDLIIDIVSQRRFEGLLHVRR